MEHTHTNIYNCSFESASDSFRPTKGTYVYMLIVTGSYHMACGDDDVAYESGELLFADSFALPKMLPDTSNSYHYLLSVSKQYLLKTCKQLHFPSEQLPVASCLSCKLRPSEFAYLSNLLSMICMNQNADILYVVEHCIANILFAFFTTKDKQRRPDVSHYATDIVRRFDANDIWQDNIKDVYNIYPVSASALRKDFEKMTGESIMQYRDRKRMEYAAELLREGSLTITSIVEALNMSSHAYFSAKFKKYFGMTPSQYKENYHAEQ